MPEPSQPSPVKQDPNLFKSAIGGSSDELRKKLEAVRRERDNLKKELERIMSTKDLNQRKQQAMMANVPSKEGGSEGFSLTHLLIVAVLAMLIGAVSVRS